VKNNPPSAGRGRPKGAKNKTTRALKEAILLAAENVGRIDEDVEVSEKGHAIKRRWATGEDGLVGYLEGLATNEPVAYAGLLGRVLPMTVAGDSNNPVRHIFEWSTEPSKPDAS
jgi:hypothetical protein